MARVRFYSDAQVDDKLLTKADVADVYSKAQTDTLIAGIRGVWEKIDPSSIPTDFAEGDVLMIKPRVGYSGSAPVVSDDGQCIIIDMFENKSNKSMAIYKIKMENPTEFFTVSEITGANVWNNGENSDILFACRIFTVNSSSVDKLEFSVTRGNAAAYSTIWRLKR